MMKEMVWKQCIFSVFLLVVVYRFVIMASNSYKALIGKYNRTGVGLNASLY